MAAHGDAERFYEMALGVSFWFFNMGRREAIVDGMVDCVDGYAVSSCVDQRADEDCVLGVRVTENLETKDR